MSPDLDSKKKHVLANFFLELSNPIRIQILRILSEGVEYRNSAIAKMLNISAQECLRHLARLLHVNLVESIGRLYRIAPIGNLVLEGIFPPLKYLLKNQSFFTNHDLSILPPIFTRRLSEIADEETEIINGPSEIIALAEQIIENANTYCYDIAKLVTRSTNQLLSQKYNQEMDIKRIEEIGTKNPKNIPDITSNTRIIEHLDIAMVVSEQEAYIRFPENITGELSLNQALYSKSSSFVNFAKNLFTYFWEQSMTKPE